MPAQYVPDVDAVIRPTFFDDFNRANGLLHNSVSPTGQVWSVGGPGVADTAIVDGKVESTQNSYCTIDCGEDIVEMWCEYETPPAGGTPTLHIGTSANVQDMIHIVGTGNSMSAETWYDNPLNAPTTTKVFVNQTPTFTTILQSGQIGVIGVRVDKTRGSLTLIGPDGTTHTTYDADIAYGTYGRSIADSIGQYAKWQIGAGGVLRRVWVMTQPASGEIRTQFPTFADVSDRVFNARGMPVRKLLQFQASSTGWHRIMRSTLPFQGILHWFGTRDSGVDTGGVVVLNGAPTITPISVLGATGRISQIRVSKGSSGDDNGYWLLDVNITHTPPIFDFAYVSFDDVGFLAAPVSNPTVGGGWNNTVTLPSRGQLVGSHGTGEETIARYSMTSGTWYTITSANFQMCGEMEITIESTANGQIAGGLKVMYDVNGTSGGGGKATLAVMPQGGVDVLFDQVRVRRDTFGCTVEVRCNSTRAYVIACRGALRGTVNQSATSVSATPSGTIVNAVVTPGALIAESMRAIGDIAGVASTNTLTGVTDTPTTEPGWAASDTAPMNPPDGYIKMYVGTQAVVVPYWNT